MEKIYNCYGQLIYKAEFDNNGNRIYEQWRWYHYNGELAGISDSKGNKVEFNINGLPIK